jgi:hypothetical protein
VSRTCIFFFFCNSTVDCMHPGRTRLSEYSPAQQWRGDRVHTGPQATVQWLTSRSAVR